ncbi:hypothetical protein B0H11DRAFT_2275944 [Mycena galericulata]|nr:hypothetical protein B0H11DRAFT_2275944 [Mycena galericulata]
MLCVELPIGAVEGRIYFNKSRRDDNKINRNDLSQEAKLIDFLELDQYHALCYQHLRKDRDFCISGTGGELDIGALICCPAGSHLEISAKIAVLANPEMETYGWFLNRPVATETMEDGWTRYHSGEVFGQRIWCAVSMLSESWLAQVNYVFTRLRITSNHEDYLGINGVNFSLDIGQRMHNHPLPKSYLFVCPVADFRTGPTTVRWPSCPAYWSLDPSGVERLSADEAERLGFPSIKFTVCVHGHSWDSSVYVGLRKFHQGKGFDPDSQDVARHLGFPLYQLFSEIELPFAHVDGDVFNEEGSDYSASIPDENLTPSNEANARHPTNEVNQASETRGDDCALHSLKSTGLLDVSISPEFRSPWIPGPLIVAGRSAPHLSFPYEGINTPWDSHPRVNAQGILTVTFPSLSLMQSLDGSGLMDPSSTSTFSTYPPPELSSISSYPPPELPSIFSAAENQSVDPEAQRNQSPTISLHKRVAEEIDSGRPQKKSKPVAILSDFLLDDLR